MLAPDVIDNADSESKTWHHAKKIKEVFMNL